AVSSADVFGLLARQEQVRTSVTGTNGGRARCQACLRWRSRTDLRGGARRSPLPGVRRALQRATVTPAVRELLDAAGYVWDEQRELWSHGELTVTLTPPSPPPSPSSR